MKTRSEQYFDLLERASEIITKMNSFYKWCGSDELADTTGNWLSDFDDMLQDTIDCRYPNPFFVESKRDW